MPIWVFEAALAASTCPENVTNACVPVTVLVAAKPFIWAVELFIVGPFKDDEKVVPIFKLVQLDKFPDDGVPNTGVVNVKLVAAKPDGSVVLREGTPDPSVFKTALFAVARPV